MHKPLPPIEHLRDTYYYNPETGIVKNKRTGNELSRTVRVYPYGTFLVYRIAYTIHHGVDPGNLSIDHIDGDPTNNRITNLRLATHPQNLCNQKAKSTNTSGYKGVVQHYNKWRAYICVNYKRLNLGTFDTPELAHQAYCDAAIKYHGEFANFG